MSDFLFVYGTLRPAVAPPELAAVTAGFPVVGLGITPGRLFDVGEHPAAVFEERGAEFVLGDVLEVPEAPDALAAVDAYEECDPRDAAAGLFRRERVAVMLEDGAVVKCWAYAYNGDPGSAPPVPGGDYVAYVLGTDDEDEEEPPAFASEALEAFAGVALAAAAARGPLAPAALEEFVTALARMDLYRGVTGDELDDILRRLAVLIQQGGMGALLAECGPRVPEELRETAFAVACDHVTAGGAAGSDALAFLERVRDALRVPEERAGDIVDILGIKNRG